MIRKGLLHRLLKDNAGATAIEYGLIISLIVVSLVVAMNRFAAASSTMWNFVSDTAKTSMSKNL